MLFSFCRTMSHYDLIDCMLQSMPLSLSFSLFVATFFYNGSVNRYRLKRIRPFQMALLLMITLSIVFIESNLNTTHFMWNCDMFNASAEKSARRFKRIYTLYFKVTSNEPDLKRERTSDFVNNLY